MSSFSIPSSSLTSSSSFSASSSVATTSSSDALSHSIFNSSSPTISPTSISGGNSTTNSTRPPAVVAHNDRLSDGAVAGVAIGCAIAGAILALIVFGLVLRSRKERSNHASSIAYETTPRGQSVDVDSKSAMMTPMTDMTLERADDSQIKKSMMDMNELINQHVENHYHNQSFSGSQADLERELMRCGFNGASDLSAGFMTSVLINPRTRAAGVRRLIAYVIIRHSQPSAEESVLLLPGSIAGVSRAMLQVKRRAGEEQGKLCNLVAMQKVTNVSLSAFEASLSKWRQLTAFLLESPNHRDTMHADAHLHSAVLQNVALLNQALTPFINRGAEAQQRQSDNLASIILEGASAGLLLFAQPSSWVFGWTAEKNVLVAFPSIAEEVTNGRKSLKVILHATKEEL